MPDQMPDTPPTRATAQRRADVLALLEREEDLWVASASAGGEAWLVPLSYYWDGTCLTIASPVRSKTTRNLRRAGWARVAVGPTRDVVMIDAVLEDAVEVGVAGPLGAAYVTQADWDPRLSAGYVFLVLRPTRVQAWREANEIPGRTLMRDGTWLV